MRTRSVLLIAAFVLCAFAASAADLTIDMQVNVAAKDYANNYLTFKGANNSVEKDQFVVDGTSGASKLLSFYIPYATEASTGISAMPLTDQPWLMYPGKPWAHLMIQ